MSKAVRPFVRARGPEFTNVSQETEVRIPKLTYMAKSIVFMVMDVGAWVIIWLLWGRSRVKAVGYWRWFTREWLTWFAVEWPWFAITLILCWIGPSAAIYVRRLWREQKFKQEPQYMPWPSAWGEWDPKGRPDSPPPEGDEYESEANASDMSQPYVVKGEMKMPGGKKMLYLEFELENYAAALKWHKFCKAVHGGKNFSYNEAVRKHQLSRGDWKRIYKAFTAQHWAVPSGRRGTPKLKTVGKHWVKMYAENPPKMPTPPL